jgi:tetratricopeptide (TPR) repeat protein
MRPLALLACVLGCAEWRLPPTFPERAAGRPVLHEQALLGLSTQGDAAVAELVDADGAEPRFVLLVFDRAGATRALLEAAPETARAASRELQAAARRPAPVLAAIVAAVWPEAMSRAAQLGYAPRPPAEPQPGRALWPVGGAAEAGALPLELRVSPMGDPPALRLLLSDRLGDDGIELARVLLTGDVVGPQLFLQGGVAWLLAGSAGAEPLRRTVGLHRALLDRGEAQLHNAHGLEDYAAGDLDAARREFGRSIAADPSYVDGLYNAAAAAALTDRAEEAVSLLARAAAIDSARVQVLGRNDEDFKSLRRRPDVRALLGLRRLPPEGVPPPP